MTPEDPPQVRSLEEAAVHVRALWAAVHALEVEHHRHDEELDTFVRTVWWRRWLFIADGWSGHRVVDAPAWRPWRRWWRS